MINAAAFGLDVDEDDILSNSPDIKAEDAPVVFRARYAGSTKDEDRFAASLFDLSRTIVDLSNRVN